MRFPVLLRASLAGVVLTAPEGKDSLAFHPSAGTSLTKGFRTTSEFALDSVRADVDGTDVSQMVGQVEVSVESSSTYEVTDLYKAVAEGRPLELLRTFDTLEGSATFSMSQAPEMPEMASTSELEGKTVAFRWNDEKGEYERSFHESTGDEKLLEDLDEDMDLRFLLPAGEIEVGGTWNIELEALQAIAMPGGNLHLMPEGEAADPETMEMFAGLMDSFGTTLGEMLEGQCVCTYKGVREEGGTKVGEVEVAIEITGALDLRELINQFIDTALAQAPAEVDIEVDLGTADLSLDYEGAGTILWNLEAGRVQSFILTGEVSFGMKLAASLDAMGESHSIDAAFEMSGEMTNEVTTQE
ncbi:MAG: hypothetical protein ABL998_14495 [Planctomycetota bacterium]